MTRLTDAEQFQRAQAFLRLTKEQRKSDGIGADAWEWLYARCHPVVERLVQCRNASRKRPNVTRKRPKDDLVAEVWAALVRKLQRVRWRPDCKAIEPLVEKIVENILISFTRRRRRNREVPLDPDVDVPAGDDSIALTNAELREELLQALNVYSTKLGAENCDLIILHFLEGLTMKEAADRLNMTKDQAWGHRRRTLEKLRGLLRGHPEWLRVAEWIEKHTSHEEN